ncbi:hypothetical protein ETAA8_21050 [Anatilimnocola aggregata]|uniref:LamG-like jellyroll fold domain-containing protein n=2 Tax=Anatilimnocola aggregata TaxID=2528021 RepID=A0A517YA00_9BACT|nr:hypothetical protein ETAA8_21050 [Anatilimnocola aggregata]
MWAIVACCALPLEGGEPHWAYRAPERVALPAIRLPDKVAGPIDTFLQHELARHKLEPTAEANRSTLLRRLTLTLHGLFPELADLADFERNQAPDAYEQQVDRLLASPRYGQHMASDWLDLARYADTHGYHADTEREQWRWRDWVIERLNEGQPFDQFTLEQLAGDLLPDATLMQRIATGFLRNHMLNDENGAIPEEFLAEYAIDRVSTVGTTWLGQTWGCARCHDHKYDPVSQREFYSLLAFFNSVEEPPILAKMTTAKPRLAAPTRKQQMELDALNSRIAAAQMSLTRRVAESSTDQQRWESQVRPEDLQAPPSDAAVYLPLDTVKDNLTPDGGRSQHAARIRGTVRTASGQLEQALLLDGQTSLELAHVPALAEGRSFTLSAWIFPTTRDAMSLAAQVDEVLYRRGWEWNLHEGKLQICLAQRRGEEELVVRAKQPVDLRRWQHVAARYDSRKPGAVELWLNGKQVETETTGKFPASGFAAAGPLRIGGTEHDDGWRGMLDEVRLYGRAVSESELQLLSGSNPLASLLSVKPIERSPQEQQAVRQYYLEHHDAEYRRINALLHTEIARRELLSQQIPSVLVMQELSEPRPTFVLLNGQYDQPGERVQRQSPDYLSERAKLVRQDRLGFARWLIDPQHPLTGRVGVNRAWQQVFGNGLVTTPDDFGLRGAKPSHPALLDWLAREWVDRGWDTKRLHRQLVSSGAFRQQSDVSAAIEAADPTNRLLARGPRQRLSAEAVRDSILGSAGLLNFAQGGPGARPYQPGDLWKELALDVNELSAQTYVPSQGAELYRRSVYLFWKRNSPPVNLTTFDAPSRDKCTATRSRTNTPLQALVLLNDPTFVEAARELAARVLQAKGLNADARVTLLLELVLSRKPSDAERELLTKQLTADFEHYTREPAAADQLLHVGQAHLPPNLSHPELAAWTNLAAVVLNLDETITNH